MLSDIYYAFRAIYIKEILTVPKITYVPSSPDYIRGVFSLRGDIESVIDLSTLMSMPEIEITSKSRLVIASIDLANNERFGILLDRLIDVLDIDDSKILPQLTTTSNLNFVEGGIYHEDKYVNIIDIKKIFLKICA
jgi:purine-binding chemotaxis protein CheW